MELPRGGERPRGTFKATSIERGVSPFSGGDAVAASCRVLGVHLDADVIAIWMAVFQAARHPVNATGVVGKLFPLRPWR